jgi:carotenoid cleavage dioxygenase-like enzyme
MTEAISALPDLRAEPSASAVAVLERAPFRWTERDKHTLPVQVRGSLPAWLQGQLVRTAPAVFQENGWRAAHWFDGLALLYGFTFENGGVSFRQRLLASRAAELSRQGKSKLGSFGTAMKRNLLQRLVQPTPPLTDNTNVNVVPWQGQWLAMTETPQQHVIHGADMATRGLYRYRDELPASMNMTAHPHFDFERNVMVNVGTRYGRKTELHIFHQRPDDNVRVLEGTLAFDRAPYLHDFGVSKRHVVLIDHPLRVFAASLLFSNRGFIEHFKWQPDKGTRLWKFDRERRTFMAYETESLFCFHVVNTFEEGEDVVFDFVAFDDARVIEALRTEILATGILPSFEPRYVRARLRPNAKRVELELLSNVGFDFPAISYAREHGRPYHVAWGVALHGAANGDWQSDVVRLDTQHPEVRRFTQRDVTYGEPVFVPRPGGQDPHDGVLLTVGSHLREERTTLSVVDPNTMQGIAHCDVALSIPLGFHGNFRATVHH